MALNPLLVTADASSWLARRCGPLFRGAGGAPSNLTYRLSAPAAMRAALHARDSVPAYRSFLKEKGWKDEPLLPAAARLALLPETDKASYIKRYSTAERCLNGAVPSSRLEIDESSGSSGTPFSCVRSSRELHEVHLILSEMARYLVGKEHVVTLNAFSMGAWGRARMFR